MIADPRPPGRVAARGGLRPLHVVVVGGGVAALELLLALHDLAAGRLRVTVIAPDPVFRLPAVEVARPFGRGRLDRVELDAVVAELGGELLPERVVAVEADTRTVRTAGGALVAYDVLVLAPGARARPAFDHAVTLGGDPGELDGVLLDLDGGWAHSAAFLVPRGCSWPVPVYELALMTAAALRASGREPAALHVVTPELRALALLGPAAGAAVTRRLSQARVRFHVACSPRVRRPGCLATGVGADLLVDRIVALPALSGPGLAGVPATSAGWIPVRDGGGVVGLEDVYAVGDATEAPVKHGGLACRQADLAAAAIARSAGVDVERADLPPLPAIGGSAGRFARRATGGDEPPGWPPTGVGGRYLGPYLRARGLVHEPPGGSSGDGAPGGGPAPVAAPAIPG